MKQFVSLLALVLLAASAQAQTPPVAPLPAPPEVWDIPTTPAYSAPAGTDNGFLTGNHNFPNFINFISNPIQNIDPRAVTALYPIFESAWVSTVPALPNGDIQVYGAALTGALSDRLAVGLNQGGLADANFSRDQAKRIVSDPRFKNLRADIQARLANIAAGGERDGLLNVGGFAQYTFIEDVPNQFLLTGGLRLEVPCGSHEVFQGYGPAEMSTYLTAGKEFGDYHVLGTFGYQFPIGPGSDNEHFFYANFHFDRRCFGWLYPLIEFNCLYHDVSVSRNLSLPTREGFIDFGDFSSTGNSVYMAAGANAVIVPERLEIGAVYTTNLAGQFNVNMNVMLIKMTIRY